MALGGRRAAEREDEAADAGVLRGEAVIVDEVAPDRHRVTAAGDGELNHLAIGFAGTGCGRTAWGRGRAQRAGDPQRKVGRHLYGRVCQRVAPRLPGWSHRESGGLEIRAGRLAPDARGLLDAPQRRTQPPQGQHFLSFVVTQDVGHPGEQGHGPARRVNVLSVYALWPDLRCRPMAGFGCRPRNHRASCNPNSRPQHSWTAIVAPSSHREA